MTTTVERNQENSAKIRWGAHFKAARETMNLTEKDVAIRLHLNPNIITIIENEAFDNGPPAIFMRGYIRSYGRILNMSEKHINQSLNDLGLADETAGKASPVLRSKKVESGRSGSNYTSWSTSLVVIVLIGLVGMWWNTHSHSNTTADGSTSNAALIQNSPNLTTSTPPSDPTPKELAGSTPSVNPAPVPAPAANNRVAQNPAATNPSTTVTPEEASNAPSPEATAPQTPPAVASSGEPTQTSTEPHATEPTAPETANPVASNNSEEPAAAPQLEPNSTPSPANPAIAEENPQTGDPGLDDTAPPKKHLAKSHHHPAPDVAQEQMDLPEPGLVPEEGAPSEN